MPALAFDPPRGRGLSRRQLLAVLPALAATSACDVEPAPATPTPPPAPAPASPGPSPDDGLRAVAQGDEAELLARYDATLARHPTLRAVLSPLRAEHAEHLAALAASGVAPTANSSPTPTRPPSKAADEVSALLDLERQAARRQSEGCLLATVALAPLLGSIAASEAAHAAVLADVPAG